MNEPKHYCRFDCDCPVDDVWNGALRAVIDLIQDKLFVHYSNCDHPNGKYRSGGYCYCPAYPDEDLTREDLINRIRGLQCNTSTQEESS